MAQNHTGQGFNFDVLHAVALKLREITHLDLREFDVFELTWAQLLHCCLNRGLREAKIRRIPVVEFFGIFAHGFIATRFNILENALDGRANLTIVVGLRLRIFAAL